MLDLVGVISVFAVLTLDVYRLRDSGYMCLRAFMSVLTLIIEMLFKVNSWLCFNV